MLKATVGNAWMVDLTFSEEYTADQGPESVLQLTLPWLFFTDFPNHIKQQIPQ